MKKIIKSKAFKQAQFGEHIPQWKDEAYDQETEDMYYDDYRRDAYGEEPDNPHGNVYHVSANELEKAKQLLLTGDLTQSPSRRHYAILDDLEMALNQFMTNWKIANEAEGRDDMLSWINKTQ